jgi:hypothetical protein
MSDEVEPSAEVKIVGETKKADSILLKTVP